MNFRTINRFLTYVNELTDVVVIRLEEEDDRKISFITELKNDFFVKSGIINFTDDYYHGLKVAAKTYFHLDDIHFNNTGSIFWIYKKEG